MAYDQGDYKRSVMLKGKFGEVEIKAHDTEVRFVTAGVSLQVLLQHAVEGYTKLAEAEKADV